MIEPLKLNLMEEYCDACGSWMGLYEPEDRPKLSHVFGNQIAYVCPSCFRKAQEKRKRMQDGTDFVG